MVDSLKTPFVEEAKELVGHKIHLEVVEGSHSSETDANVEHLCWVHGKGPSLITDQGDFAVDHVRSWRAA